MNVDAATSRAIEDGLPIWRVVLHRNEAPVTGSLP